MNGDIIDLAEQRALRQSEDLYCITYISYYVGPSLDRDLSNILKTAREFNEKNNITGLLLANKGIFMQVLEGAQAIVKNCYTQIQQDTRHKGLQILRSESVVKRSFASWDMAYVPFNALDKSQQEGFIHLADCAANNRLGDLKADKKTDLYVSSFFASITPANTAP